MPRPPELEALGADSDLTAFNARLPAAVDEVVQRQLDIGIDIVNDGEYVKRTASAGTSATD